MFHRVSKGRVCVGFSCVLFYWFMVYALGGAKAESWKVEGSAGIIVTDHAGN
jgi:hypothetical protein